MSEEDDRNEGLPLWEALERLAPEELCRRYRQIANYENFQMFVLGEPPDPRYQEVEDLKLRLSQILLEPLQRGELIASGIEQPPKNLRKPRQDIAPDLWPLLSLDLIGSEAQGCGLKLVAVRIRGVALSGPRGEASDASASVATSSHHEAGNERSARKRGPESLMPVIKAEMIARAERGELLPTLAGESRFLKKWATSHHPSFGRLPQAKSIQEAVRKLYNDLKGKIEPGI